MTYSAHLTKIEQWVGNVHVFNVINDQHLVDIAIRDIENHNGTINIEILQFVDRFLFYHRLEDKRKAVVGEIGCIDDYCERLKLGEEICKVEAEQRSFIKNTLLAAHQFIKNRFNPQLEKVAELFFVGNITGADKSLEAGNLTRNQQQLSDFVAEQEKLEQVYDRLEDNANEFIVKAKVTMLNLDIENPRDRFQKSISVFDLGLKSAKWTQRQLFIGGYSFQYAHFLEQHKQFSSAYIKKPYRLRTHAKDNPKTYLPYVADVLNNLANLQSATNEYTQALVNYRKALQIYRYLAQNNAQTYLPYMAGTLNNLALLQRAKNEFTQALSSYQEALQIYRELAQNNAQTYLPYMAGTLNNLAGLQKE